MSGPLFFLSEENKNYVKVLESTSDLIKEKLTLETLRCSRLDARAKHIQTARLAGGCYIEQYIATGFFGRKMRFEDFG